MQHRKPTILPLVETNTDGRISDSMLLARDIQTILLAVFGVELTSLQVCTNAEERKLRGYGSVSSCVPNPYYRLLADAQDLEEPHLNRRVRTFCVSQVEQTHLVDGWLMQGWKPRDSWRFCPRWGWSTRNLKGVRQNRQILSNLLSLLCCTIIQCRRMLQDMT